MGVLGNAAAGAATGAVAGGPVGAIIGAGGSVLSSLLGGIFGSSAQEDSNATNLQIARERNELQERLFNQQIANDWKMFDATNTWNSAAEQRKRMVEAGYNPNMIFGSGLGSASNISSPSAPNMVAPTVQPVDAFAKSLSSGVGNAAQTLALLSQARKADAETTGVEVDNLYKGALHSANLNALGASTEAQVIKNRVSRATEGEQVAKAKIDNILTQNTADKVLADKAASEAQADLTRKNIELSGKQIELLGEQIALAIEQGKTEISKQALNLSEKQYYDVMKVVEPILKRAQANQANASAEYSHSLAVGQGIQNQITKKYGDYQAYADAYNTYREGRNMDEMVDIIKMTGKLMNKDLSTYDARLLIQFFTGMTSSFKSGAEGAAQLAK